MAMSGGKDNGEPMMEMNMTPLIDVLLVLIIMFIITIPVQTHAVKVDLPVNSKNPTPPPVEPQKNKILIYSNDTMTWNGTPIDESQLNDYLLASLRVQPEPELHFQPLPDARYEKIDRVMAIIKRAGVSKLGFVGNEQYANEF